MVIPLAIIICISDQATKFWTEATFPVPHNFGYLPVDYTPEQISNGLREPIVVIPGNTFGFTLDHVINQGAAWGMFQGRMGPLSVISATVFLGLCFFYLKFTEGYFEREVSLGLLQGGIFGNFIDRIGSFGRPGVVDFLDFTIFHYDFPAFNIADAAICIGVIIYCISSFKRPELKKQPSENTAKSGKQEASG